MAVELPDSSASEKVRFDFVVGLLYGVRKLERGKDGVRRFIVTKEKFMELKALMKGAEGAYEFFDKAEKEGTEFGLYDDIGILCGMAGPYYKNSQGKDIVYIVIRA